MTDFPMKYFCYGIAQGELCRISNRLATVGRLNKEDKKIVKRLRVPGEVGEHIAGMAVAFDLIDPHFNGHAQELLNLDTSLENLATQYHLGRPVGVVVNECRIAMLMLLRELEPSYSDDIAELIRLMGLRGIVIHLDKEIEGEDDKP